jgi:cytochrome c556
MPANTLSSGGLFNEIEVQEIKVTLIKEYKEVDYLLKISTDDTSYDVKAFTTALTKIPQVISAYQVNPQVIKQQDYLIFE